MSLLLDALKKAEKAKEAAQRGEKKSGTPGAAALSLEPTPEEAKRVMTRDKLPDISTPLEFGSDDLSPRPANAAAGEAQAPQQRPPKNPQTAMRPPAQQAQGNPAAQRAVAQSVFQAKFKEPNPRLPFYVTMGVLGAFAIGTIVYFWIQLRPPPPLVNLNPQPSAGEVPVAAAPVSAAAPRGAQQGAAPSAQPAQTIPGLPASTASATATSSPAVSAAQPSATTTPVPKPAPPITASGPSAQLPAAAPKPAARVEPVASAAPSTAQSGITRSAPSSEPATPRSFERRAVARVNPGVAAGYAAFQSGDLERARDGYREALRTEPRNIDALLGMAAVELRARQFATADRYYQQVLRLDPRNPHAQAGMLALRNQEVDPVAAESRVKSLMAREPNAEGLQFTLGNQYAQQSRWGDAQQAYFRALASDPENPDFAYNLAVSLDHLRQVQPALQHYRLALQLAERRGAGFDAEAVRARIAQLER